MTVQNGQMLLLQNGEKLISAQLDGKSVQTLLTLPESGIRFYTDGETGYYQQYVEGDFFSADMKTGETKKLAEHINMYDVGENALYAVQILEKDGVRTYHLLTADKAEPEFREISLSFDPLCAVEQQDGVLFVAARGKQAGTMYAYAVYRCDKQTDGSWKETKLEGVSSVYMQPCGKELLFLDSLTYQNPSFTLKALNTKTGEIRTIADTVYGFYIVDGETVCAEFTEKKESQKPLKL